jgi:anti-sigma B factor antagonist
MFDFRTLFLYTSSAMGEDMLLFRLQQLLPDEIPSGVVTLGGTMALKTSTLDGGIGLIEVRGSLVGGDETDELRQAIAGFVAREYAKLVIDLSGVTYLNSTAIGVLVSAQATYARRQWQIKLCGINRNIDSIFVITKLTLVFDVRETRADAVKSFAL